MLFKHRILFAGAVASSGSVGSSSAQKTAALLAAARHSCPTGICGSFPGFSSFRCAVSASRCLPQQLSLLRCSLAAMGALSWPSARAMAPEKHCAHGPASAEHCGQCGRCCATCVLFHLALLGSHLALAGGNADSQDGLPKRPKMIPSQRCALETLALRGVCYGSFSSYAPMSSLPSGFPPPGPRSWVAFACFPLLS